MYVQGDSGSGLVCEGPDGRWYAVGLVSIGRKCGEISFYTRLSEMVDFVEEVLGDDPPPGMSNLPFANTTKCAANGCLKCFLNASWKSRYEKSGRNTN